MNRSANHWLAVREITDARFRSSELAMAFASLVGEDHLIVDLACGTGTNVRYLSPFLPSNQRWLGIDVDSENLAEAATRLPPRRVDLKNDNLVTGIQNIPTGNGIAITGSAFLDLASEVWLTQFAHRCHGNPILIAMSTVGQPEWCPAHSLDASIRSRIEKHQRRDHGFGDSLGPDAAHCLAKKLEEYGCRVEARQTDWILGKPDESLVEMMIAGVARRVQTMHDALDASEWAKQRRNQLLCGELQLVIKHLDLLSTPPGMDAS